MGTLRAFSILCLLVGFPGVAVSLSQEFYRNGNLKTESKEEGSGLSVRSFSDRGVLQSEERKGLASDRWRAMDAEGRVVSEELSYAGGERSERKEFFPKGRVGQKELFRNGKRVGRIVFDPQGRVIRSEAFHEDGSRK